MKRLLIAFLFISASSCVFAKRLANKPEFEENYIKMAAKTLLCGGVTLKPLPDFNVRVMAQYFSESLVGDTIKPGKILSKSEKEIKKKKGRKATDHWVDVDPGGMRVRYDSAGSGLRPSAHYRVFCQIQNERGNWTNIPCSKVISLEDVKHNKGCVIGPAGPSANYSPLNMKT